MAIKPKLLLQIQKILTDAHNAFVANFIGPEAVDPDVLKDLKARGKYRPQARMVVDAYMVGRTQAKLGAKKNPSGGSSNAPYLSGKPSSGTPVPKGADGKEMGYAQVRTYLQQRPIPLSDAERQAIHLNEVRAAQYLQGLGNRTAARTGDILIQADAKQEAAYAKVVTDLVSRNIANRETVQQLRSDLGHATGDWARDFDRIALTEKQAALQAGVADGIAKDYGKDARVYKQVHRNACQSCRRLYLHPDGTPIVFTLSELQANGNNVGVNQQFWKPVLGPAHPNCLMPGTTVETQSGLVAIEKISPGDLVLTHKGRYRPVRALWSSDYDGEVVKLKSIASQLTCTPNHEIWDGEKWSPAGSIKTGFDVAHRVFDVAGNRALNSEYAPSQHGKDVSLAHVLYGFSSRGMPSTAIYLNGKFFVRESQVDEEQVDDVPNLRVKSCGDEGFEDHLLAGAMKLSNLGLYFLQDRSRTLFASPYGSMCRISNCCSLLRRHLAVSKAQPLCGCSQGDVRALQTGLDVGRTPSNAPGNLVDAGAVLDVQTDNFPLVQGNRTRGPASRDTSDRGADVDNRPLFQAGNFFDAHTIRKIGLPQPFKVYRRGLDGNASSAQNSTNTRINEASFFNDLSDRQPALLDHPDDHGVPISFAFDRVATVGVDVDGDDVVFGGKHEVLSGDVADGVKWVNKPVSVSKYKYHGVVYNLSVEDDESYVAEGMVVHNCTCALLYAPDGLNPTSDGQLKPDDEAEKSQRKGNRGWSSIGSKPIRLPLRRDQGAKK